VRALSKATFFGPFCFHGSKKPSSSKLDFLLNSARVLPTLCVKASAQKASRARLQKCNKNYGFFQSVHGGNRTRDRAAKKMQALYSPFYPTRYACGVSGCNLSRFKSASFKSIHSHCKIGFKLLTPAVFEVVRDVPVLHTGLISCSTGTSIPPSVSTGGPPPAIIAPNGRYRPPIKEAWGPNGPPILRVEGARRAPNEEFSRARLSPYSNMWGRKLDTFCSLYAIRCAYMHSMPINSTKLGGSLRV
jgi:hypothetical protein